MREVKKTVRRRNEYVSFAVKSAIFSAVFAGVFSVGLIITLGAIVPDAYTLKESVSALKDYFRTELQRDKTRIRFTGLVTNNPAVHYKISLLEEEKGNLGGAIEEIELAIGLLEMHSADKSVRDRYARRLDELKRKQVKQSKS